MNAIAKRRAAATRYVITDARGRWLMRHWRDGWRWTSVRADRRVFRRWSAADKRARLHDGARVQSITP